MDHWHIILEGFPARGGDVITRDGEVIGTYTCDENDYCEFTPNGADAPVITSMMIGLFCQDIKEWHSRNSNW